MVSNLKEGLHPRDSQFPSDMKGMVFCSIWSTWTDLSFAHSGAAAQIISSAKVAHK
jgi:hypothetical protein